MRVFVYGTLKRGYGNNRLLEKSTFVQEHVVDGYKLYNSGFPVAAPAEGCKVKGEIWDIGDDKATLDSLDRLESNGYMYNRTEVEPNLHMYVGIDRTFRFAEMQEEPNVDGVYYWDRQTRRLSTQ